MCLRETLIKTKSPRSNAATHAADFVTLRFNQRVPMQYKYSALSATVLNALFLFRTHFSPIGVPVGVADIPVIAAPIPIAAVVPIIVVIGVFARLDIVGRPRKIGDVIV